MSETPTAVCLVPSRPRILVDRDDERNSIIGRIGAQWAARTAGVFVLTGMPGVGKTSLALWCAHELLSGAGEPAAPTEVVGAGARFDVVLHVSMGASARALSVEDAMTIFLPALGVSSLPTTTDGMVAAYRAALADRSSLILLDDVASAEQLNALLPGAARSVVIATSRRYSEGFEHLGFDVFPVGVFTPDHAKELLSRGMDPVRAAAEDRPLGEVAELCGWLPLALGIARAHLLTRHRGVAGYVDRLRAAKSRLAEFRIENQRLVENVYEVAYQELSDDQRMLYRLLGLHAGRQFDAAVAAALLGPDYAGELDDDLYALKSACLLTDIDDGRFELHSLVHLHARGLATATLHPADCRAALRRMVRWYLEFAVAREQVLSGRIRFGELFDGRIPLAYTGPEAYQRAIADLELERANLRRALSTAADEGFHELAWQLCEALFTFYFQRDLYADAIAAYRVGSASAQWITADTGDARPQLRMCIELGTAYFAVREHDAAMREFRNAEELATGLRDEVSVASLAKTFAWQAFVHQRHDEYSAAVRAIAKSRALVDDPAFPARIREREHRMLDMNSGPMLAAIGRHDEAIALGRSAVEYFRPDAERHNYAKSVANLGGTLARLGGSHDDEAVELLSEAVELEQALGLDTWLADSCEALGAVLLRLGRGAEGRELKARAAALFGELGGRGSSALGTGA
ncbi:NB-ARC domain-containing protein [Nocardia callitridis]|uniref:NB-ARC domain-containing protein n=1 Tax=Nocardia callitridis TaxID=648753 RepID=A0ABP9JS43_9NOCA